MKSDTPVEFARKNTQDIISYKFWAKKTSLSTLSGLRHDRCGVTMLPPVLKTLSDGQLVAHTDKYFFAKIDRIGNCVW